jgi:hypothetical protein
MFQNAMIRLTEMRLRARGHRRLLARIDRLLQRRTEDGRGSVIACRDALLNEIDALAAEIDRAG